MPQNAICPTCETPLPSDAPGGACPRCLLVAGLQSHAGKGAAAAAAPSPSDLAAYFPALEILELLGQGGMGIVYKARQKGLNRLVALKILAPEMAGDAAFSDRFTREARALAKLSHANIVGVHEFGETEGLYYFAMEYVDGANLREAMREGHLTAEQALAIVPQICDALQYAHDNGVVHRDIKPENVLIAKDGHVKIADFGLAKLLSPVPDEFTLTRAGQVMGTPHYMAPEQIESPSAVDHRADIYSLGVVFYEMLTGELPLGRFQPPSRKVQMDVRLDDVVLRALEKAPDRRYQQVSEVKTRVNGLSTPAPAALPAPVAATNGARSRLSRLALAGFVCFPVSIVASLGLGWAVYAAAGGRGGTSILSLVVVTLPTLLIVLSGVVLSISGWVAVNRSNGRLRGKGFAVAGTFLPALLCLPLTIGTLATSVSRQTVATAPVPVPTQSDGAVLRSLIGGYLNAAASGTMDLEVMLAVTTSDDADRIRALTPEDRAKAAREGELGPLFWLAHNEGESLRVRTTELEGVYEYGWIEASTRTGDVVSFVIVREADGVWRVSGEPLNR